MLTQERTQIYFPKKLKLEINKLARAQKTTFSEFIRQAVEQKITVVKHRAENGAEALLNMARSAKDQNVKGPCDLSENHNKYLY